jgi:ferric-dicitrate binding protein FerR (iron transport regulator)
MQKLSYSNSLNSEDKRTLEAWKKLDTNASEEQLSKILFHTSAESDFDAEAKNVAYERFLTQINSEPKTTGSSRVVNLKLFLKVAAAVLLLAVTWVGKETLESKEYYYSTSSEKQFFTLPDGSAITLNSNSELVYIDHVFGDREARLLKGKGMFDVARDESRPFKVQFDEGKVEVLGTEFVVDLEDQNEVSVTVREGKVAFMADESRAVLTEKEKGVFDKVSKKLVRKKRRSLRDFDWLIDGYEEEIYYTYSTFVDQLEDDFNIVIQDNSVDDKLKECELSFNYYDNPDAVIHILEKDFEIVIQQLTKNNLWIFSGGNAKRCK